MWWILGLEGEGAGYLAHHSYHSLFQHGMQNGWTALQADTHVQDPLQLSNSAPP